MLKSTMRYRAVAAARKENNPWAGVVAALHAHTNPSPAPRKLPAWQLYMGKKGDLIDQTFATRYGDVEVEPNYRLAFRAAIARELLDAESDDYKQEIQKECDAMHDDDVKQYEAQFHGLTTTPSDETALQQ